MYNEQNLKNMLNYIQSKLDIRKNIKFCNNTFDSYNNKNIFINFNDLNNSSFVYVIKVENSFRFNEHKHIVDIVKMYDLIKKCDFQTTEIKELVMLLVNELNMINQLKTKKGDKLYFLCPVSISEYCPVCSFIGTLKNINKVPTIIQSNNYVDNEENNIINITKLFSDINNIVDIFQSCIYVMTGYYVPCVIYDESANTSNVKLMQFDRKKIEYLSQSCHDLLENYGVDMMDVNVFMFRSIENENGLFPNVYDIEFKNIEQEQYNLIINDVNIVKAWRKVNIEGKIFASKSNMISDVQNIFENIFNSFSEKLNDIITEFASVDGLL